VLSNLGASPASATITLYNAAGTSNSTTPTMIQPKQSYIASFSQIWGGQGMFSLEVDTNPLVEGLIITAPADLHSFSFRELSFAPLSSSVRTINVPLMIELSIAEGDIFLTNFSGSSENATITLYDLYTGSQVQQRQVAINPHSILQNPLPDLIGAGVDGVLTGTVSAPGTIQGVFTLADPDNDKAYYPLR